MFGSFRFILASLVILSHTTANVIIDFNFTKFYFNVGRASVFAFYILAGIVTTKLFINIFQYNLKAFLIDRFLRIYPMAWFWQLIGLSILYFIGVNLYDLDFNKILFHLSLIPLNYSDFLNNAVLKDRVIWDNFLFPPYFSLGLEFQAYLIITLCLFFKKEKLLSFLAYYSFFNYIVFSILNIKNTQFQLNLTYSFIISTIWVFYLGYLIQMNYIKELKIFYFALIILLLIEILFNIYLGSQPYTTIGLLIIIPLILKIKNHKNKKLKIDTFLGSMSFIIYCNHYLFIFMFDALNVKYNFFIVFFFAFVSGLFGYFAIEKPLNKKRIKN